MVIQWTICGAAVTPEGGGSLAPAETAGERLLDEMEEYEF